MKDSLKVLVIIVAVIVFIGLYLVYSNYSNQHKVLSCYNKTALNLLKGIVRNPKNSSNMTYWEINPNKPLNINNIIEYRDPDKKIYKTYCEATIQNQSMYYNIYNQKGYTYVSLYATKP